MNLNEIHNWLKIADFKQGDESLIPLSINLIQEEFDELKEAKTEIEFLDCYCDLLYVINNHSYFKNISIDKIENYFEAVTKSNFSKFCKTKEEAIATCNAYNTGTHFTKIGQIINSDYFETGNKKYPFVVKRKSDMKILKSINYKEPIYFLDEQ